MIMLCFNMMICTVDCGHPCRGGRQGRNAPRDGTAGVRALPPQANVSICGASRPAERLALHAALPPTAPRRAHHGRKQLLPPHSPLPIRHPPAPPRASQGDLHDQVEFAKRSVFPLAGPPQSCDPTGQPIGRPRSVAASAPSPTSPLSAALALSSPPPPATGVSP